MSDRWIEAEFEAIFREHYQRIVRVVRRVLQRDSEAEEVCAEVFFRLYRSGPGVAASGLVGGWLYRTAARASIDALRADRRRGVEEQLEGNGSVETEGPTESPLAILVRRERIVEVREVLAKLKVAEDKLRRKIPQLLERVGLGAQHKKPIRSFSKGMMQRVGLAQAIVNDPEILFLDEPTSGLDPAGRKLVREVIAEQCSRGATVFLNSHLLGEVEQSCDRVAFIRDGRIIGMYEMGAWQSSQTEVEIGVARVNSAAIEQLKGFTQDIRLVGQVLQLRVGKANDLPAVVRCLVEAGAEVFSVVPQRLSLEDLFLQMMGPDPGL